MRKLRITTRCWVLAVTIIALILAGGLYVQRRSRFLEQAESNAMMVEFWNVDRQRYLDSGTPLFKLEFFEADGTIKPSAVKGFRRLLAYHAELERKYRFAATFPWLSVAPDPPYPR